MAVAGTLEIQLLANIARLQKDMDDAKRSVGGAMATIEKTVGGAVRAMGLLGGALSIGAFVSMAKQAIDTADAINKLTQRTGLAAETLSQLQYAARLADVSSDSLTTGIKKLNQSIAGGLAGDKEKLAVFKSLGITLTDTAGRTKTADQVLLEMADTFAKSRDGAGKTAAAIDLLGKAGDEMIPLLNGGSQAILDLMKEADRLGLTISGDFAARAEEFNDNLTRIQTQSEKLAISLGGDLVDGLGKAMKAMADAVAEGNKLTGVVNFIQTLLTGDDRYKAQVKVVTETEKLMAAQSALDRARGSNNEKEIARLENAVRLRKAELDMHRNYLAMLDAEEKKSKDAAAAAAKIRTSGKEIRTIDSGAAKAANKEIEEQDRLLAELAGLSGSFAADWARLNTIYAKGAITLEQLTAAQANLLAQQPAFKKEQKEQEDAAKKLIEKWAEEKKVIDELIDSRERQFVADAKVIKSAEDMLAQAQFELSLLGLSNVERDKAVALRQLEATGIDKATLKYAELAEAMSKTVTDRAAMQKQIDDFQNVWNSIDRTAQQTFTNIFEGGQDAFTKLRDTLKATLLDLLYQMTVRKWVFNLAANVTGASSGVAGVVGQSVLGQAGNALGLGSMFSGGGTLTGYASQALGAVGLGNVGAGLAGVGGSFASSVGAGLATDALGATVAEGAAAATLGAGSTIGAAIPYIGAALVAGQALGLFDSKGGPKTIGGASDAATIQATVQATLAQFGIRGAGLRVGGFSAADPQGDSLTQLQTALFQGDRALYSRQDRVGNYENVGRSSEELAAAWAEETARITLAALKNTLEPKYQQYLREVDANTSSADAINAALARVTTARTLEERLLELSSTEAENLARARARELDAMDETLRPLLRQIQAQEDLKKRIDETNAALLGNVTAAYDALRNARGAEVDQLGNTVTRLRDYGRSLREFRDGLLLGNLSTLTPGQRLEEARRQLENTAQLARGGDVNAQGQVQGLVSAFLEASATYNASGAGFTSDFAYTQQLLTELANTSMAGADVAQLQLDALGVLNQSVLTIPAALTSLAGAITTAIGAGLNPGAASIAALAGGLTGERIKTDAGSVYASASGAASLGNVVYTKNGKTFTLQELQNELIKAIVGGATSQDFAAAKAVTGINRDDALEALRGTGYESRLPAFRNGGSHMGGWAMVGEGGPELAYMPPSRIYSNSDTRQMLDIKPLVERIKSLEGTVQQLGQALVAATYDATSRAADKTVDGVAGATSRASFAAQTVPVLA